MCLIRNKGIHGYTGVRIGDQGYTCTYRGIHGVQGYTWVPRGIHEYKGVHIVYKGIHGY